MTPRLALRQRPDTAFEKLYRQHVGDVYRYSLAVLGNPADAEDVTQTTFLNAYRAIHAGERPRKPAPWLRTIAHNVCRQRWRQASRRPHEVAELDDLTGPAAAAVEEEPDAHSAADITHALQSLPFNQRTALVMRELEGRRQAEIARELDLSESAVEALLFRARRAMREQLESSITCGEAARAISRQLDRSLSREERSSLRAHLRSCEECAGFARQARAQRGAMKALGAVPLPAALLAWKGGAAGAGAGSAGGGLAAAAGGGSGVGATAAAAGGGTAAAFGLKVAAGIVAVAVVASGGERILSATETDSDQPAAGASQAGDRGAPSAGRNATVGSGQGNASAARPPSSARGTERGKARAHTGAAGRPAKHGRSGAGPGHANHATPVRAHGTPAQSNGTPAPSNGNATRSHGSPSQSQGTPTRAHGSPPASHGTPTRAHGSPTPPPTAHGGGPGVERGNPHGTPPRRSGD